MSAARLQYSTMHNNVAAALPRALIFDVDGTLAETEELHRRAFNATFAEFGFDWVWDAGLYRDLLKVTGGKERMAHYVERHRPAAPSDVSDLIPRMHLAKNARYASLVAAGEARLRPGVARLVREAAAAGVRVALATTTSRANVEALLLATFGGAGARHFPVQVVAEDTRRKKPDPEVYAVALARLELSAAECVAFEDSRNGLLAARAAGIPVVITPSLYTDHERFDDALAVVSDLGGPEQPYRHIAGAGGNLTHVDLAALRTWLSAPEAAAR